MATVLYVTNDVAIRFS